MDFSQTVFVNTNQIDWIDSPMSGVYRKPLAREEKERGHATSLVRYDAGSVFRAHPHPLGEEILVLDGVFSDEQGDFPAGSYFRNPPGSSHAPHSIDGCLLLVKLHQFKTSDLNKVYIDASNIWSSIESQVMTLYQFDAEKVWLVRIHDNQDILSQLDLASSVELFVISGQMSYGDKIIPKRGWLREPLFLLDGCSVTSDCFLWIKTGHF